MEPVSIIQALKLKGVMMPKKGQYNIEDVEGNLLYTMIVELYGIFQEIDKVTPDFMELAATLPPDL